jgi:hypothetical protein
MLAVACAFLLMGTAAAAKADRQPSWAVGTFRGYNDKYDLDVWLRISRDGRVERAIRKGRGDVERSEGSWDDGRLAFGGDRFDVYQRGSGIRTVKVSDRGDVTTFRRTGSNDWGGWGGSGGSGWGGSGGSNRPPGNPYIRITEPDNGEQIRGSRTGIMGRTNAERVRIRIYLYNREVEERTVDTRRDAFSSSFPLVPGEYRVEVEGLYGRNVIARSQVRFSVRRR